MANPRFRRVIQYLWDSEPQHTDFDNDIVCLGRVYSPVVKGSGCVGSNFSSNISSENGSNSGTDIQPPPTNSTTVTTIKWPSNFLSDVESRIWMTYRTNFPLIPRAKEGPSPVSIGGLLRGSGLDINGFTSDVGWGCMIRTGQSLLANAISAVMLGRDWRVKHETVATEGGNNNNHILKIDNNEAQIIYLFQDSPSAPFSVHNFVKHGETACGKMPGEWFGPSAAASSIKALTDKALGLANSTTLQVYISDGSDVYENEFMRVAKNTDGTFQPTLILLGLRLGIDSVNEIYWDSLKQFLSCPQAIGIAGGRPSSSHYFYGYQGNYLFYLDPHFPRPCLSAESVKDITIEAYCSVHTDRIRRLHLNEMDPSMLLGILIKNQQDWDSWKDSLSNQKVIHISADPVSLRRSSLSTGSDDGEEGFVDVVFEPLASSTMVLDCQQEAPVLVENTTTEYDSCQVDFSQSHHTNNEDSAAEIVLIPNEEREHPSIFMMEQETISASTVNINEPGSEGIVIERVSEGSPSIFSTDRTSNAAIATNIADSATSEAADDNFHEVDEFGEDVGSLPSSSLPKRNFSDSISSSPVKVTGFESEEWEYMARQTPKQQ